MDNEKKKPLFSDEFLDELAEEINQLYGAPNEDSDEEKKVTIND